MTDRPTGALSGTIYDYFQRDRRIQQHAAAEGCDVSMRITLESYDRTLHPWTYGRRPADILKTIREQARFFEVKAIPGVFRAHKEDDDG